MSDIFVDNYRVSIYNIIMHAYFFEGLIPDSIKEALDIRGIPAYGLMIFLAIACAAVYFFVMYKKYGFTKQKTLWLLVYLVIFGLLGAHVFSLLFRLGELDFSSWDSFISKVWMLFSSLMYYGGFIGGLIGLAVYAKKEDVAFFKGGDFAVCVLPLVHSIGRVGCFLAGCCYGMETDAWYGVDFIYGNSVGKVVPTQLFEVAFNSLLFIALMLIYILLYRKHFVKNDQGKPFDNKYQGLLMAIYMIAYPIYRFIVEFVRNDQRGAILGLSTSQFISIFVLGFGIYLLVKLIRRLKGLDNVRSDKATVEEAIEQEERQ